MAFVNIAAETLVWRGAGKLLASCAQVPYRTAQERGNAWRACLGKPSRREYLHRFHVRLVKPDGSTITIPSSEPKETFQAAVDLTMLSEDERRQRLAARKPKARVIKQEVIDDNFNESDYMKFWSMSEPDVVVPNPPPKSIPAPKTAPAKVKTIPPVQKKAKKEAKA